MVRAYQNDGVTFIDVIRDAPLLSGFTEAVNSATKAIKVVLPRRVDAYDGIGQINSRGTVAPGNVWKWTLYGPGLPTTGLLRYQGYIDAIEPKIDESGGETVEVTITPFSQIMGDHGILGPLNYGTANTPASYIDTGIMFSSLFTTAIDPFTSQPYGYPFTLDPTNPPSTGISAQYAFQNQTLSSATEQILLMSSTNWFTRPNPNTTMTFNTYPTTATHTLMLGQHITSLDYAIDNTPRKNLIIMQGKGVVATAAGASIATVGQRVYIKTDSRITDQNTAQQTANGILALYDRLQVRTKVKIPDYRGDLEPGIGYDIEKFKPGQTVRILDAKAPPSSVNNAGSQWGSMVWGRDKWGVIATASVWGAMTWGNGFWGTTVGDIFHQVVPIVSIDYYYNYVELSLGWRQPSLARNVHALEARLNDYTVIS